MEHHDAIIITNNNNINNNITNLLLTTVPLHSTSSHASIFNPYYPPPPLAPKDHCSFSAFKVRNQREGSGQRNRRSLPMGEARSPGRCSHEKLRASIVFDCTHKPTRKVALDPISLSLLRQTQRSHGHVLQVLRL